MNSPKTTLTWQHTDTQTGTSWITPNTTNFRDYAETLGVGVYYDDLRPGIDGLYIPNPPSLFIRPGAHPHYENWLGWHELGHHITGTRHITTVAGRARVEDLCDLIAAENILPLPLLGDPALFDPDFAQWAYNLRVPPRALKTRLNSLSRNERPIIDPHTTDRTRTMRTRKTLPLLAASALLLAGCTNGANQATQETTPSESPTYYTSTPEQTTPAPEVPKEVTYRATSNLPGEVYWSGNGENHEQKFTDSFEVTLPVKNEYDYSFLAVTPDYQSTTDSTVLDTAQVSCQVLVNGEVVQEKNGTGSSAGANCSFPLDD